MSADIESSLDSVLGALLIGLVVHTFLGGVTLVQLIQFYTTSSKDSKLLKGLVFVLAVLDISNIAFLTQGCYYYMVQHFNDIEVLLLPSWGHAMAIYLTATSNLLCSLFMCKRLWILWQGRKWLVQPLVSTIVALSFITFGTHCAGATIGWDSHKIKDFSSGRVAMLFNTALATAMTADILITGGLYLSLHHISSKFKETNRIISWITTYVISSCLLTTLTQMFTLIAYIAWPNTDIFIGIWFVVPKLYFNSLLATLNSRAFLQRNNRVVNVSTDLPLELVARHASGPDYSRRRLGPNESQGIEQSKIQIQVNEHVETSTELGKPTKEALL